VDAFKLSYPDIQLKEELFLGRGGNVIDALVGKGGRSKSRKVHIRGLS
jgi:hypothetical protein